MFGFGACEKRPGGPFGFGAPPWAQQMHGGKGCGGPAALFKSLDLKDEQLERLAELKLEGMSKCAQMKAAMGEHIKLVCNELTQDRIDKAKIKEIAEKIKAQKSQFGESMLERVISFAEILTPEQRKKLKATAIRKFLGLDIEDDQED